ncbi:MAG TPA: formate dehydrogenase accessory protein FdhE, partial [Candidatus Angelobacter sp.]|nr:formate dehydrogenase accessory protein FdhE [Candidatus Angelobacter sp.]
LHRALDLDGATNDSSTLLAIVRARGPQKLAGDLSNLQSPVTTATLEAAIQCLHEPATPQDALIFLSRVVLEPQAEHLASSWETGQPAVAGNRCPICGSLPQLAVLRQEGDGGKRRLLCALCHTEWDFRRVLCPACGEENHEKLPRYTAEGIPAVRVEACDTCRGYLKSVDLTIDGLAVPLVDEVAAAPLDLWAAERDYRKIVPNIMGF